MCAESIDINCWSAQLCPSLSIMCFLCPPLSPFPSRSYKSSRGAKLILPMPSTVDNTLHYCWYNWYCKNAKHFFLVSLKPHTWQSCQCCLNANWLSRNCEDRPMALKSFYIHWQQYAQYFVRYTFKIDQFCVGLQLSSLVLGPHEIVQGDREAKIPFNICQKE